MQKTHERILWGKQQSTDATSYSEERDRTEYHQDYYSSNLELSHIIINMI